MFLTPKKKFRVRSDVEGVLFEAIKGIIHSLAVHSAALIGVHQVYTLGYRNMHQVL
jgi:hypothetical protein